MARYDFTDALTEEVRLTVQERDQRAVWAAMQAVQAAVLDGGWRATQDPTGPDPPDEDTLRTAQTLQDTMDGLAHLRQVPAWMTRATLRRVLWAWVETHGRHSPIGEACAALEWGLRHLPET